MRKLLFAVLGVWAICAFVGCSGGKPKVDLLPAPPPPMKQEHPSRMATCAEPVSRSVMQEVMAKLPGQYDSVNVDYYGVSVRDLDREQREIFRIFEWSKTISDSDVRGCYESWLGYYDYELRDAYTQLAKNETERKWKQTHSVPKIPSERQP